MKLHPRVTQTAVDLAKRFEGFRPRAGKTPDARYTIGYGHILGARDKPDEVEISEAEAEFLLKLDLSRVAEEIEPSILAPLNDNQFAALLSFAFNIGTDNFKGCSALRRLNEGAYLQAAAAIELWRRADFDGETLVVDQLVRRRAVEKALFLAPPEGFTPVPSAVLKPTFDHSVIGAAVAWAAARERTAVSRLALEGPEVSAGLAVPPGREGEPAPSAAIAAADALTVRLSRILPENMPEPEDHAPPAPELLALQSEPAPPEPPEPVAPVLAPLDLAAPPRPVDWIRPSVFEPAPETPPEILPELLNVDEATTEPSVASPKQEPEPHEEAKAEAEAEAVEEAEEAPRPLFFREATSLPAPETPAANDPPAFLRAPFPTFKPAAPPVEPATFVAPTFDDPIFTTPVETARVEPASPHVAEPTVEPPPLVEADDSDASSASPFRRRFGARMATAMQQAGAPSPALFETTAEAPSLFDAPARAPAFDEQVEAAPTPAAKPYEAPAAVTPLFERPAFFVALGLIGVALFAGSIFCMLNKASFTCLLIGVVGVLAMAPAAAFFLFRFLGAPVDHTHADHADMVSMMQTPAAASAAEPVAEATPSSSAFDRVDWR